MNVLIFAPVNDEREDALSTVEVILLMLWGREGEYNEQVGSSDFGDTFNPIWGGGLLLLSFKKLKGNDARGGKMCREETGRK